MTNETGFTSLTALTLVRTCFNSEQDRLQEFAKSLRVPIQSGEIIKGDSGTPGKDGPPGPPGARGQDGIDGATPQMVSEDIELAAAIDNQTVPGDIRNKIINLCYDDVAADPPSLINIMALRFDGTDTIVYLSAVTPDDKFFLRITGFA